MTTPQTPRRRSLLKGAAVAAGAMSAPMVAVAQTTSFRFQSTWPAKDIFHEFAQDFAKKVNDMAGNRLKIEVLPSGAVGAGFPLLEGGEQGHAGRRPCVWSVPLRQELGPGAVGLGPAFGMNPNMVLAWHYYGGGKACWKRSTSPSTWTWCPTCTGPMQTQPLGWFKKPISNVAQMKGLKYRTVGLAVDMFTDLGAAVNPLPGGEIVPALDRGLIEAAEFNNAPSTARSASRTWRRTACCKASTSAASSSRSCSTRASTTRSRRSSSPSSTTRCRPRRPTSLEGDRPQLQGLHRAEDQGQGRFYKTPDAILKAQLDAWDKVVAQEVDRQPVLQARAGFAAAFASAQASGSRLRGRLQDGLEPLLRREEGLSEPARARPASGQSRRWPFFCAEPSNTYNMTSTNCCTRGRLQHLVGKAFAWLIVALMLLVCVEVFKRYILNMPTAWVFDVEQHAVRHAVHDVRAPTRSRRTATCAATSCTAA
jgi:TRAP-type mannitol/chloroaromatic compound transport system substrate-binding protein